MRCTILLLAYFVYNITEAYYTGNNLLRIFGGRDAVEEEFPYVVVIGVLEAVVKGSGCTGVVLTPTWTLTAGHCVVVFENEYLASNKSLTIVYRPSIKTEFTFSDVLSTKLHPTYTYNAEQSDIGLLHTQPVHLNKYGKLSPIEYSTLYGQDVVLVGYGGVNSTTPSSFPVQQVLDVIVRECQNDYELYPKICFAPRCSAPPYVNKSICHGDSGGPAIHASGVIAITSRIEKSINVCDPVPGKKRRKAVTRFTIGVSTPTSTFIDWISSITKK